jgi:hypothetical protein
MQLIEAHVLAARLKLNLAIAHSVFRETAAMGWPKAIAKKAVFDAEVYYRENSPIFVESIEVLGRTYQTIEDGHIGHVTYSSRSAKTFNVKACTLEKSRDIALALFDELAAGSSKNIDDDQCFKPYQILLKDQFGRAVGMLKCGKWVKPFCTDNLFALKAKENESYRLALIETSLNNSSKALALREMAQNFEWLKEMSEAHEGNRVVKTSVLY